jgi:hypothetical protein
VRNAAKGLDPGCPHGSYSKRPRERWLAGISGRLSGVHSSNDCPGDN